MRRVLQPVVFAARLVLVVIPNVLLGQSQTNLTHALINGQPVEIHDSFIGQPPTNGVASEGQTQGSPDYSAFSMALQAGNVSEMMKQAQALVKAYPNEARAHIAEGDAYSHAGLKSDALTAYQRALQLDPKSFQGEYSIAGWYFEAGDPTNALEHYERAVKIKPESATIWFFIGSIQYQVGNFKDAATALTQAVKLDATDSSSWLPLGGAFAHLGDAEGAKAAYLTYYKLNPKKAGEYWDATVKQQNDFVLKFLQGIVLKRQDELEHQVLNDRAQADMEAGQDSMSRQRRQMSRRIEYIKTGDDLVLKGKYEEAIEAYQEANKNGLSTTSAGGNQLIGLCYCMLGKHNEAIDAFHVALADDPEAVGVWWGLLSSFINMEQFINARKAMDEILASSKTSASERQIVAGMELSLPAIEAASEVRRQTFQESTKPASQNGDSDKKL